MTIDGRTIDAVLNEAVESGKVPHVAAIAADRDGIVYEGAAGVRVTGETVYSDFERALYAAL